MSRKNQKLDLEIGSEVQIETPLGWAFVFYDNDGQRPVLGVRLRARGNSRLVNVEKGLVKVVQDHSKRCPGWLIDAIGNVVPCNFCQKLAIDDVYDHVDEWCKSLPKHPQHRQDHDECSGCCGFSVHECSGSAIYGRYALLSDHECGCFANDVDAHEVARYFYRGHFG